MRAAIAAHGAASYLRHVSHDDPAWARFTDRLEHADPEALSIAATLRPSADAGSAEALDTAAARALPLAPEAVLGLTRSGFEVGRLCTSPFIEPGPGVERRHVASSLRALDAMPVARRPRPAYDRCRAAMLALSKSV